MCVFVQLGSEVRRCFELRSALVSQSVCCLALRGPLYYLLSRRFAYKAEERIGSEGEERERKREIMLSEETGGELGEQQKRERETQQRKG